MREIGGLNFPVHPLHYSPELKRTASNQIKKGPLEPW